MGVSQGLLLAGAMADGVFVAHSPNEASIRTAVAAALAAGGGIVTLPDGGSSGITLTSPLPLVTGVIYNGIMPRITHSGNVPDNDITFVGGSWFDGDGTFPCFQAQDSSGNALDVDKGSPDANFTTKGIRECGLHNVGIQNFSRGVSAGAANQAGLLYAQVSNIWIKDCTDWALYLKNFQHLDLSRVWSFNCQNGQGFWADVATATLQPGNSKFHTLFDNPVGLSVANARKHRSLVFGATAGSNLNEMLVTRLQSNNGGNRAKTTYTTATGGSGQFTLQSGKGAELQVGMQIKFTNAGGNGNITVGYTYFIKSISTDTVTVSATKNGSAITGSFSTSTAFTTYGWGTLEVVGATGGSVTNCVFDNLDLENVAQGALTLENCQQCDFMVNELYSTSGEQHVIIRTSQPNFIRVLTSIGTDIDGSSVKCQIQGTRIVADSVQYSAVGFSYNSALGNCGLTLSNSSIGASYGQRLHDIEAKPSTGGPHLRCHIPISQRVYADSGSSSINANGGQAGVLNMIGSGTGTFNLPTPAADYIGIEFTILNHRSGIVTIDAGSTKINNLSGHTQVTLPAVTGTAMSWARCKLMCDDYTNPSSYYWFVEFGPGAAIV